MYSGGGFQPASTAIQYLAANQITTNDHSLYDYGSGVSGHQIPQVHEAGIYEITYSYSFSAATVGDRLQGFFSGDIGSFSGFIHGIDTITYATGSPAGDNIGNTASFKTYRAVPAYPTGTGTLPQSENPTVQNLTAARSYFVKWHCFIEKIYDGLGFYRDGIFTW
jgi:hypothetical protein